MHRGEKQINIFAFNHFITVSRQWDLQQYFLLPALLTNAVPLWQELSHRGISLNRPVATTFTALIG